MFPVHRPHKTLHILLNRIILLCHTYNAHASCDSVPRCQLALFVSKVDCSLLLSSWCSAELLLFEWLSSCINTFIFDTTAQRRYFHGLRTAWKMNDSRLWSRLMSLNGVMKMSRPPTFFEATGNNYVIYNSLTHIHVLYCFEKVPIPVQAPPLPILWFCDVFHVTMHNLV